MIAVTEEYRFGAAVSPYVQVMSLPFKMPISIERRGGEKNSRFRSRWGQNFRRSAARRALSPSRPLASNVAQNESATR
jgi:hypothetical protein